jgi:hypothetical protein
MVLCLLQMLPADVASLVLCAAHCAGMLEDLSTKFDDLPTADVLDIPTFVSGSVASDDCVATESIQQQLGQPFPGCTNKHGPAGPSHQECSHAMICLPLLFRNRPFM